MKKYAIKKSDGTVAIMYTAKDNVDPELEVSKWTEKNKNLVQDCREITTKFPSNLKYVDAWDWDINDPNSTITVDLTKAKSIQIDFIKEIAASKLKILREQLIDAIADDDTALQDSVKAKISEVKAAHKTCENLDTNNCTLDDIENAVPSLLNEI